MHPLMHPTNVCAAMDSSPSLTQAPPSSRLSSPPQTPHTLPEEAAESSLTLAYASVAGSGPRTGLGLVKRLGPSLVGPDQDR